MALRAGSGKIIVVEAKAHIPEMVSPATQATEPALTLIGKSLVATKQFLGSRSGADRSNSFYQGASGLAHLYLRRELNGIPAYLAFIYFVRMVCDRRNPLSRGSLSVLMTLTGV
jgi:hypothetical protein